MHKLSTILRLLLLVFLIGGLGITQPAEAQQTVTLSGRVTDSAGQCRLECNRESGRSRLGWAGDETRMAPIASRWPPGTYRLRVRPRHGPLISHKIEGLRLSANTTRNFVLETGVTLSGQVTSNGQPVPWAWLWVTERRQSGGQLQFCERVRSLQPRGACWNLPSQTCIAKTL